ncbi:hypothetical protein BJX99DRAFT_260341 [Aspergillus californicus]
MPRVCSVPQATFSPNVGTDLAVVNIKILPNLGKFTATRFWDYLGADSISDWDGHVQLNVPSLECIANALNDPFYKEVVVHDEDKFTWARPCMRTVGYEECFILNSQLVQNPPLTGV